MSSRTSTSIEVNAHQTSEGLTFESDNLNTDAYLSSERNLYDKKAVDVLSFLKSRLRHVGTSELTIDTICAGSASKLARSFRSSELGRDENDDLKVESIGSGCMNLNLRVYDSKHTARLSLCSSNNQDTSMVADYEAPSDMVFVKAAMPYVKWAGPEATYPVQRLDREYFGLETFEKVCPGYAVEPLLCDVDHIADDGSKYLVTKHLPPGIYEQYMLQFRSGRISVHPAKILGEAIAQFHVHCRLHMDKQAMLHRPLLNSLTATQFEVAFNDTKSYIDYGVKTDDISVKYSNFIKSNPDLIHAMRRLLDNLQDPSDDVATYVHFDMHIKNILVRTQSTSDSCFPEVKLLDWEFSNYGPCGVDLGIFLSGVLYYLLVHSAASRKGDIDEYVSTCTLVMTHIWDSYKASFIHAYQKNGSSHCESDLKRSIRKIERDMVGYAGFNLWKFTAPRTFKIVRDVFLTFADGTEESLCRMRNANNEGEDGMEALRESMNILAARAIILGFGDVAEKTSPYAMDDEQDVILCDGPMKLLCKEALAVQSSLAQSLRAVNNAVLS